MTREQLQQAFELATSNADLSGEDYSHLCGFGLPDFKPVFTTTRAVARMIRWQCVQMNGGIDYRALTELAQCGRKRFLIID